MIIKNIYLQQTKKQKKIEKSEKDRKSLKMFENVGPKIVFFACLQRFLALAPAWASASPSAWSSNRLGAVGSATRR